MSEELKPCPFCGSKRLSIKSKHRKAGSGMEIAATYSVRCNVCHARGGAIGIAALRKEYLEKKAEAERLATVMWNKRTYCEDKEMDTAEYGKEHPEWAEKIKQMAYKK